MTWKGTLRQGVSEFKDWRYRQSCGYFWPTFVNCCPSNLLSGSTPQPPFPVSKYTIYRQCVAGRGWECCWVLLKTIFCRSLLNTLYLTRVRTYKIALPPKKPRREGGLRQISTCRKILYRPIFRWWHFALVSIKLISPWLEGIRTGIVWNIAWFTSCAWRWKKEKFAASLLHTKCDLGRNLNLYSMYDHTIFTTNNV